MRFRLWGSLRVAHFRTFQRYSGSLIAVTRAKLLKFGEKFRPRPSEAWTLPTTSKRQAVKLPGKEGKATMLWTIFVILLVLWLVGLVSSYTMGGFIHLLLVLAVVVLIINLITGRRTV